MNNLEKGLNYQEALRFSELVHRDFFDEKGFPFVGHPVTVARNICSDGYDKKEVILGFFHDVVKHDYYLIGDIKDKFGDDIAETIYRNNNPIIVNREDSAIIIDRYEEEDLKKFDISGKMYRKGSKNVQKALEDSISFHKGQFRKLKKIPYVTHPIGVARNLSLYGCGEELITAGLFHDVLEMTEKQYGDIREGYGKNVADIVEELTDDPQDSWEDRKSKNIENFYSCSRSVRMVGMADKLDNLESMQRDHKRLGDETWEKFNRPKDFHAWYFGSLKEAFSEFKDLEPERYMFERFDKIFEEVFDDYEKLKKIV